MADQYRHKKRGTPVTFVGEAILTASDQSPPLNGADLVVYQAPHGLRVSVKSEFEQTYELIKDEFPVCPKCGKRARPYTVALCGYHKDKEACAMRIKQKEQAKQPAPESPKPAPQPQPQDAPAKEEPKQGESGAGMNINFEG